MKKKNDKSNIERKERDEKRNQKVKRLRSKGNSVYCIIS